MDATKMNDWLKKYAPWIISTICIMLSIAVSSAVAATQLRDDVDTNKAAIAEMKKRYAKHDDCLVTIQVSLGRIETQLDLLLDERNERKDGK